MNDTIVSISTLVGNGAISIIKLSGENSIKIVNKFFKGKDLEKVSSHTINYGHFYYEKELIDEVLVSVMRAPKTYTKEDIVEINCHGGVSTTNKILDIILKNGTRQALPGEFTKRAFLNGRIDMLEASAIKDLIEAESEYDRKKAISKLNGNLSKKIVSFRDDLKEILSNIEINIDYPEYQDIEVVTISKVKEIILKIEKDLENILKESLEKKHLKGGIKIPIIGKPNVGKSSILNKLIREEKAIVTNIKGTTRDVVEGKITINGFNLIFYDTAGIRKTKNEIEKIGVLKSYDKIEESNFLLLILDNSEKLEKTDIDLISKIKEKKHLIVINKSDLSSKIDEKMLKGNNFIKINTFDDKEIKKLKDKIIEILQLDNIEKGNLEYFDDILEINLAKESLEILSQIKKDMETDIFIDMIGIDIKKLYDKLGEIIGISYDEEIINNMFNKYCVGK